MQNVNVSLFLLLVTLGVCFGYIYCASNGTSTDSPNYVSCKSPSKCIEIVRCLSHRSSPDWQTTGETCGPGVFALRQICCLGPTLRPRPPKKQKCGIPFVNNPLVPLDNNGTSQDGAWPWMVSILWRRGGEPLHKWCSGSLIDNKHVITSANCLRSSDRWSVILVRVGNTNFQEAVPYTVNKKVVHPGYQYPNIRHNIAILKLAVEVKHTNVSPVCLPNDEMDLTGLDGTETGWPLAYKNLDSNDQLMHISNMNIMENSECNEVLEQNDTNFDIFVPNGISEDMVCAEFPEGYIDECMMDDGSPLMIKRGSNWFVVGISAYCNNGGLPGLPVVFTRVSKYLDWIKSAINT